MEGRCGVVFFQKSWLTFDCEEQQFHRRVNMKTVILSWLQNDGTRGVASLKENNFHRRRDALCTTPTWPRITVRSDMGGENMLVVKFMLENPERGPDRA